MPTWVILIGAALGGGMLLFLAVVFVIRRYLRKMVAKWSEMDDVDTPIRLKTVPKPADQPWNSPEAVAMAREFFEKQSFDWVGDVALQPMERVYASMLVDRDGFGAVVYDHAKAGVWVDVMALYPGRGGLTASNASLGGHLKPPPFSHKFYLAAGTLEQVWATFQDKVRAIPPEGRQRLTRENFIANFESAYADEIDWRNAQGGPSEEEIRLVARESEPDAADQQIERAVSLHRSMAYAGLEQGLLERFREIMTPQDHLRFRLDDLCFVHPRLQEEDLLDFVSSCVEDEEWEITALPEACRDLPPLEAFERLQTLLPDLVRFEKVGSLDFPLPTDIYRPPNGRIPLDIFPLRNRWDDVYGDDDEPSERIRGLVRVV